MFVVSFSLGGNNALLDAVSLPGTDSLFFVSLHFALSS